MNKGKAQKSGECQKRKNYIKAPTRCLETNFYNLENINEQKGSEEMTTGEVINLLEILKEKGYTLNEAVELFKRIANKK